MTENSEETAKTVRIEPRLQASFKPSNNPQLIEKYRVSVKPEAMEEEKSAFSNNITKIPAIMQSEIEKKLRNRVHVIQEFLSTEEKYMNILFDLINTVIIPCRELQYLTNEEEKDVFSNIETIAKFSERFLAALKAIYNEEFDTKTTLFAETIVKMQPFFLFFNPYCINYQDSRMKLEKIRKEKPQFHQWLKNIELTKWDKVIDSLLIEPVQRLPRYVLLMKEIRKNTPTSHPDYKNIEKALQTFEELNNTVNKHMAEYLKTLKLFELAEKYGKFFKHDLVDPKRKFLEEEAMTLISDGTTKQVICYFLTDMLLVTEHVFTEMKLIKSLHFHAKSYVYDIPNTKHYQNLVTIYGEEEGLTFILDSQESKSKLMHFLNKNVINEIKSRQEMFLKSIPSHNMMMSIEKSDEINESKAKIEEPLVNVTILGTVKRGLEKISPFIVYFTRIQYGKFLTDIFLRYRELKVLDDYVRKHFQDIKFSSFPKKKLFHQKTKTIDGRKIDIQNFLQVLLNSRNIRENSQQILKLLNLPHNFYQLWDVNPVENSSFFQNLNDLAEKLLRRFSVFRILYDFFRTKRPIYSLLKESSSEKLLEKELEIETPDENIHKIRINKYTKALDLCYEIANNLSLVSWLDYKLVLEKNETELRVIDDDEFVFKALNIDEILLENREEEQKKLGFFEKLSEQFRIGQSKIKEFFKDKFKIKFKKCIFPHSFIEKTDYTRDFVRLNLICCQAFQEISKNKYDLSLNDFCFFAGLYAFIKYGSLSEIKSSNFLSFFDEKIVAQMIPETIFVQEQKSLWMSTIMIFWKKISAEITKIIETNRFYNESLEENIMASMFNPEALHMSNENSQYKYKISDEKRLAQMITMKYLMTSEMYGTHNYMVLFRKFKKGADETKIIKIVGKLVINFKSLKLFAENQKEDEIISLKNIDNFKVFPEHLEICLREAQISSKEKEKCECVYSIYSSESIEIYRTIELYFEIGRLTADLKKSYLKKMKQKSTI